MYDKTKQEILQLFETTDSLVGQINYPLSLNKQLRKEITSSIPERLLDDNIKAIYSSISAQIADQDLAIKSSLEGASGQQLYERDLRNGLRANIFNSDEKWWYTGDYINSCLRQKLYQGDAQLNEKVNIYPVVSTLELVNIEFLWPDIYNNIKLQKKRFDIIALNNTPQYSQGGSHWAVMFIDHEAKKVSYFDSKYTSNLPLKDLLKKIKKLQKKESELNNKANSAQSDEEIDRIVNEISLNSTEISALIPIQRAFEAYKKLSPKVAEYSFEFSKRAIQENDHDCGIHAVEAISAALAKIQQDKVDHSRSFDLGEIAVEISGAPQDEMEASAVFIKRYEHLLLLKEQIVKFNAHLSELVQVSSSNVQSAEDQALPTQQVPRHLAEHKFFSKAVLKKHQEVRNSSISSSSFSSSMLVAKSFSTIERNDLDNILLEMNIRDILDGLEIENKDIGIVLKVKISQIISNALKNISSDNLKIEDLKLNIPKIIESCYVLSGAFEIDKLLALTKRYFTVINAKDVWTEKEKSMSKERTNILK